MALAQIDRLIETVDHDRHVQFGQLGPDGEQALVIGLDAVEIRAADTQPLGAQHPYGAVDLLHRRLWVGQVGMGPEVELVRHDAAEGGQFVIADPGVFVPELAGPIHERMRRRGQHQLVDPALGHDLEPGGVGHPGQQIGLCLGVVRGLYRLFGAQREMADGQSLRLHERPPERMSIQHPRREQVGVDVDQHRLPQYLLLD